MRAIGVEAVTAEDGTVQVHRVRISGKWRQASQGRQWLEPNGRHVLIMLEGREVHEIMLRSDTLMWQLVHSRADTTVV